MVRGGAYEGNRPSYRVWLRRAVTFVAGLRLATFGLR